MLEIGKRAPYFNLKDGENNNVSLDMFKGKKIVLYFYPKDMTSGCTAEAIGYKNEFQSCVNKNTVVIGVSKDSIKSHISFKEKYDLPFILLSDENLEMIKAYDCWHEKSLYGKKYMGVLRTTYLINEEGVIIYANNKVDAKNDASCMIKLV